MSSDCTILLKVVPCPLPCFTCTCFLIQKIEILLTLCMGVVMAKEASG